MRIRYGLPLLLLSTLTTAGIPYSTLAPKVTPEGDHIWTYATQWNAKHQDIPLEEWIQSSISSHLARQQLCPNGWEIIRRYEPMKNYYVVEGRCKSA